MSDIANESREEAEIALEYELDAAPEKVWRAIAVPAFRMQWLPQADLAQPEPIASIPGVEVRYRMREEGASFPESTVTFRIEPGVQGGALLRIAHDRARVGERVADVAVVSTDQLIDRVFRAVGDPHRRIKAAAIIGPGDTFLVKRIADGA